MFGTWSLIWTKIHWSQMLHLKFPKSVAQDNYCLTHFSLSRKLKELFLHLFGFQQWLHWGWSGVIQAILTIFVKSKRNEAELFNVNILYVVWNCRKNGLSICPRSLQIIEDNCLQNWLFNTILKLKVNTSMHIAYTAN